ncbi:hypothetical protein [Corynebacterium stationis]|uniref:hypothetical protein n=1 Tax=Corynebacterium stationis TaxID=1705 RepID=UPI00321FD34D
MPEETSQAQEIQAQENVTPNDVQPQEPVVEPVEPAGESSVPNSVDELPDWAQSEIRKAREEAAKYRTRAKDTAEEVAAKAKAEREELIQTLGRQLGLVEDETNDPDKLLTAAQEQAEAAAKERDTLAQQLADYRRKDAVNNALAKVDGTVDTALLNAVLASDNAYNELDINADDFTDQVSTIITQTIESHPSLVQATHKASGVDTSNTRRGNNAKLTREDLDRMYANGEYAEINKAFADGRFNL